MEERQYVMKEIVCKEMIYIEGKYGWFLDEEENQIYQIELETKKVHYIGHVAGHNSYLIKKCGEELYIFPEYCKGNIVVYNLMTGDSKEIELNIASDKWYETLGVWETKDVILAYSAGLCQIIEINKVEKNIVKYHNLSCNELRVDGLCQNENDVHIIYRHDKLIMADYIVGSIKYYSVRDIDHEIWGFTYDNGYLWINKKQGLYFYNVTTCKTDAYVELPDNLIKENAGSFVMATYTSEHYIWFVLLYSNKFMYLNKKSKEIKFLTLAEESTNGKKQLKYMLNFVYENRYLHLYSRERDTNFIVDMETALYWDIEYVISDDEYQKSIIEWMRYTTEKKYTDIHKFLSRCAVSIEKQNNFTNIGKKIYQMV